MGTKIEKVLAIDVETSGINYTSEIVSDNYQIVSIGLIVASVDTYEPIEEMYRMIQWNGKSEWSDKAESIHCLSKQYLSVHGIPEEQAVEEISMFLYKHFGMDTALNLLGHNVVHFDLPFFRQMLWRHGMLFKFAHRHFDTFSLSMGTVKAFDSNELYSMMGFEERKAHNALEDARMALKSYQLINTIWNKCVA